MASDIEHQAFLAKAAESLTTAESELANHRYNSCANRCYYACFQAAIVALMRDGITTPRADGKWSHAFVQAEFARLLARRKQYPEHLKSVLGRLLPLRERADYQPGHVSQKQVARAVRTAREFVEAIQAKGGDER